ncbi:uncharacterized protein LOC105629594 [Jatropha curcas]|uniref:uncharacterized protein LOC105629594 n=1 Tax=Jatropha curcas TaxID=180498 RepID=UPI0005FB6715|nr:uncharacterized protein LOC105629594 [Jatropha curcas]
MAEERTLWDLNVLNPRDIQTAVVKPPITVNNFELKLVLISMVQQSQFAGLPSEDPNVHLATFIEISDTLKINGAVDDAIQMRLFPFSSRDRAKLWLHFMPPGSFTT